MKELWSKYKAEIGLGILIVYTLTLGVATADEIFHLGLFPTKLDKMIATAIQQTNDPDQEVAKQASKEIVEYGDFAVPQLISALDGGAPQDVVIASLKQITGQDFSEPAKWKEWYSEHRKEF